MLAAVLFARSEIVPLEGNGGLLREDDSRKRVRFSCPFNPEKQNLSNVICPDCDQKKMALFPCILLFTERAAFLSQSVGYRGILPG